MKTLSTSIVAITAVVSFAGLAFAQSTLVDSDGSGTFSYAELAIGYPNLTEEVFVSMDTDESGDISAEELSTAYDAGLLPQ